MSKSLYIHIPFCKQKCLYCDFYSIRITQRLAEAYIDALCRQIATLEGVFSTIYIGGGTPSSLDYTLLENLLTCLQRFSRRAKEITIEVNPDSADKNKLALFYRTGINRVSIGVQSFADSALQNLGRIHNRQQTLATIATARAVGFKNIGIDLIFGLSGQTMKGLKYDLQQAVKLPITHISAYALSYEKHTPLYERVASKRILPLDDDAIAKMYGYIMDFLPKKGFLHYEISNFAKKGFTSMHNSSYWNNDDYVGLGPSAASYLAGRRTKNTEDIRSYINKVNKGQSTYCDQERLSARSRAKETAAIKIRAAEGINFAWFKRKTGFDFITLQRLALEELTKERLISISQKGISLTRKGFLFCDSVSSEFL